MNFGLSVECITGSRRLSKSLGMSRQDGDYPPALMSDEDHARRTSRRCRAQARPADLHQPNCKRGAQHVRGLGRTLRATQAGADRGPSHGLSGGLSAHRRCCAAWLTCSERGGLRLSARDLTTSWQRSTLLPASPFCRPPRRSARTRAAVQSKRSRPCTAKTLPRLPFAS